MDQCLEFNNRDFELRPFSDPLASFNNLESQTCADRADRCAVFKGNGSDAGPLSDTRLNDEGKSWRTALCNSAPVLAITAGYIVLWLSLSGRNSFVTHHDDATSLHFFPVYTRALFRLFSAAIPFVVAIFVVRRMPILPLLRQKGKEYLFFAVLIALATFPFFFLTYQTSIPSRATYYPSVGLAAIVGILFYMWHMDLSSRRVGIFGILCLFAIDAGNIAYVWLKKDPQYIERAAATRQLVLTLNYLTPRLGTGSRCASRISRLILRSEQRLRDGSPRSRRKT